MKKIIGGLTIGIASTIAMTNCARAQQSSSEISHESDEAGVSEIIVTAQKREQSVNDVPISIAALDGADLAAAGVRTTEDLARVVPGLSFTETQFDAPVLTLRGVGYSEISLSASPTVSVYVDQVPLPYPAMIRGRALDLERVEVLKGPQGTLFGQNSTGGAINYVAAKPTDTFEGGISGSIGRFSAIQTEGFASGPLSGTVRARLALSALEGGAAQRSVTRGDELGNQNLLTGRLLFDWDPSDSIKFELNLNGWLDRSDTPGAQLVGLFSANGAPLPPEFTNAQIVEKPRAAEWTAGLPLERDNSFYQASLRGDWTVAPKVTLTSITAYQHFKRDALTDADGLTAADLHIDLGGNIRSFTQELRLAGVSDHLNWIIGGNYQSDRIRDLQQVFLGDSPSSFIGPFHFLSAINDSENRSETAAFFGNAEYRVLDHLSVEAGARYTHSKIEYLGCTKDSGANDLAPLFSFIQGQFGVPATAAAGQCITLLPDFSTGLVSDQLKEHNLSWRLGLNFKPRPGSLVYANVSRGFKAGSFPTLSAQTSDQLAPAVQEELLAYEAGFKLPLAGRSLRLTGAAFYYDYKNKQLSGRIQTLFGQLQKLVNIPRSSVQGGELQLSWVPVHGLSIDGGLTYLKTRIRNNPDGTPFQNFDQFGNVVALSGNAFPYTPKWQGNLNVKYDWALNSRLSAFVGSSLTYRSKTKGGLENDARLVINSYTLTDIRAGIEAEDKSWSASVYGRNIFNRYYWNNVLHIQDTIVRYTGRPAEFGIALGYRF